MRKMSHNEPAAEDATSSSDSTDSDESIDTPETNLRQNEKEIEKKKKKGTIKYHLGKFGKRVLPHSVYAYGRTVYGGNPIIQQTLPGWFAYLSPFTIIPLFFLLMIPFVVVGVMLILTSQKVYVVEHNYSHIHQYQYAPKDPSVNINQGIRTFTVDGVSYPQGTKTWMQFEVKEKMKAPVYFYYTLDHFFQNLRDFHDGRNMQQLKGDAKIGSTRLCRPFQYPEDFDDDTAEQKFVKITKPDGTVLVRSYKEMIYNPCGLAAWSKFNDTLRLYKVASPEDYAADPSAYVMGGVSGTVPLELICDGGDFDATGEPIAPAPGQRCHKKGVGMKADLKVRYRPITPREDWWSLRYPYPTDNEFLNQGFYNNEAGHSMPDLMDVDLHVWMRSSLLNQFKKLYRVIDVDLQPGTYMLQVDEFFDTVSFRGKKGFALRCKWWVGENNTALGILYLALGACCLILGVAFGIEFCLQKKGMNRLSTMKEPRRSWYLHDPQSPQMEAYFNRRLHRHIPFAELNALRALEQDSEEED